MPKLELLDIGARGGMQWPWKSLRNLIRATAVEPDKEEAHRLREEFDSVIDKVLWSRNEPLTVHVTRSPGASSVLVPNRSLLDQFPESDRFDVLRTEQVIATTVDRLGIKCDFAKIDTQGAELAILEGGLNTFQELVGLEVEVEFCALYKNQPLFSDVDQFVRTKLGLELFDIRRTYWKYKGGLGFGSHKGRLIFGDALYLKPIKELSDQKLFALALSAIAYGYYDYAATVMRKLSTEDRNFILNIINKQPFRHENRYIFRAVSIFSKWFQPTYNGWAASGETLGSRRWGRFWV